MERMASRDQLKNTGNKLTKFINNSVSERKKIIGNLCCGTNVLVICKKLSQTYSPVKECAVVGHSEQLYVAWTFSLDFFFSEHGCILKLLCIKTF